MNFDLIVKKIMSVMGFTDEKEVAKLFELSPPDFSARKKRGSILPFIVNWGINEGVNLDWLLKEDQAGIVAEKQEEYSSPLIKRIDEMLYVMDEEAQRDVLKYAEKTKLLGDLITEKQQRKAG